LLVSIRRLCKHHLLDHETYLKQTVRWLKIFFKNNRIITAVIDGLEKPDIAGLLKIEASMNAKELFSHWDGVRRDLLRAVDLLIDAQLDFTPRPELRTVRQVLVHIAEAEQGWFRYVVEQKTKSWDEAGIRTASYPTVASLKRLLANVHESTDTFLATLPVEELNRLCEDPWGGPPDSVRWIIWHVLEHEIHHRGELFLMLGLLGMQAPDI
jgi:uncharacterized damage-inducible protein DinB